MDKSKGWKILFESAKIICSYRNDVLFEFYGSESRSDSVKTINENFIGEKNIKYYGPAYGDKKFEILNTSDIFVFPPIEPEAFPLVILEAMAFGLPVVTTDQGGITEAIIDGKGGFIVEKNDPKDLAEKLEILINDKELRLKMSEFNRQRYLENFTLEKFEENWIRFFNTIDKEVYSESIDHQNR